jgi:hypothetical protein
MKHRAHSSKLRTVRPHLGSAAPVTTYAMPQHPFVVAANAVPKFFRRQTKFSGPQVIVGNRPSKTETIKQANSSLLVLMPGDIKTFSRPDYLRIKIGAEQVPHRVEAYRRVGVGGHYPVRLGPPDPNVLGVILEQLDVRILADTLMNFSRHNVRTQAFEFSR